MSSAVMMPTSAPVLLTTGSDAEGLEKLAILEKTGDGFEIAEADLRLRGPGDMLGTAQSGLAPLKLGDLFADADLMKLARNHAFLIFEREYSTGVYLLTPGTEVIGAMLVSLWQGPRKAIGWPVMAM